VVKSAIFMQPDHVRSAAAASTSGGGGVPVPLRSAISCANHALILRDVVAL